jgi:ribosomal protein S2
LLEAGGFFGYFFGHKKVTSSLKSTGQPLCSHRILPGVSSFFKKIRQSFFYKKNHNLFKINFLNKKTRAKKLYESQKAYFNPPPARRTFVP